MPPLSTRRLPNHITATVERLRIAIIVGIVTAKSRLTRIECLEQVLVGDLEARLLVAGAHEGADDAYTGQGLAHDLVDAVELGLHGPEERYRRRMTSAMTMNMRGRITTSSPDNGTSSRTAMITPPMPVIGRQDHDRQGHEDDHLDLLHVVGVARDERGACRSG